MANKYKFSNRSIENINQCHEDLKLLIYTVMNLQLFDFGVTCGHRTQEEQDKLYVEGKTKLTYPNSKHNHKPSLACDISLYINGKIEWDDLGAWRMVIGVFRGVAAVLDIKIRVGADWDGDFTSKDQNFHDLPHIELITEG